MRTEFELLQSPKLKEGDLVRLISPASYPPESDLVDYSTLLESWGLRCDTGNHVVDEHGYMAGTDSDRLFDINSAYRDPTVRAIITTRGGAGAYRIADDIDFSAARSDPKPLIGFSDITHLHLSLLKHCRLGNVHGCLWGANARRSAKQLLMSPDPLTLHSRADALSAGVNFPGRAQGRLIGGNLRSLGNSVGVHMPSLQGAILFLEHSRIGGLGSVDRYLTQLYCSGSLDGVAGVVLGSFECLRDFSDRGWTVLDVLNDRLGILNVPVLGGIFAGHDLTDDVGNTDQYCLPLGATATLDADVGTLTIESIVY